MEVGRLFFRLQQRAIVPVMFQLDSDEHPKLLQLPLLVEVGRCICAIDITIMSYIDISLMTGHSTYTYIPIIKGSWEHRPLLVLLGVGIRLNLRAIHHLGQQYAAQPVPSCMALPGVLSQTLTEDGSIGYGLRLLIS